MNRRDLLSLFAGLPFMGWLKPVESDRLLSVELVRSRCDLDGAWPASEPFWIDEEVTLNDKDLLLLSMRSTSEHYIITKSNFAVRSRVCCGELGSGQAEA